MPKEELFPCQHGHVFDEGSPVAERRTWLVMWLTAVTMVIEIAAGWWFNSMALLADGWHMGSHALAIGLSAFAYAAARHYMRDRRFAFGTWKIEVLAGYTSAVFLVFIAGMMVVESVQHLLDAEPIQYREAIAVAVLGLAVNVISAVILGGHHHRGQGHGHHDHEHDHDHSDHGHEHYDHGQDLNLRAAYVHVVTDAATSILAIVALVGGWLYGWAWLDPAMGVVGAILVAVWAVGLIKDTGKVLLDREMDDPVVAEIRRAVETEGAAAKARVSDLHVWRVGRVAYACTLSVATSDPSLTTAQVRRWIAEQEQVVHTTIELHYEE